MRVRTLLLGAICILGLTPPAGLAQTQAPSVSPLVVNPEPMAPVPEVGEGAPLYSVPELVIMQEKARDDVQESRTGVFRCTFNHRQAIPPKMALMTRFEVDSIGAVAAKNGGRILLDPPIFTGDKMGDMREAYAAEGAAAGMVRDLSIDAQRATAAAEAARRAAARGAASAAELERTELARQRAVNRVNTARSVFLERQEQTRMVQQALLQGGPPSIYDDPNRRYQNGMPQITVPDEWKDLALERVETTEGIGAKGDFIRVSGEIRNGRARAVSTPPISVTVLDEAGSPLQTEVAEPKGGGRIEAGQALVFAYELAPKPRNGKRVVVTFGSNRFLAWRQPIQRFC